MQPQSAQQSATTHPQPHLVDDDAPQPTAERARVQQRTNARLRFQERIVDDVLYVVSAALESHRQLEGKLCMSAVELLERCSVPGQQTANQLPIVVVVSWPVVALWHAREPLRREIFEPKHRTRLGGVRR